MASATDFSPFALTSKTIALSEKHQQDDETISVTGVFGGTKTFIYFSSFGSDWMLEVCSQ